MISTHNPAGGGGSKRITIVTPALDVSSYEEGYNTLKVHFNEGVTVTKIIAQVINGDLEGGEG